MKRKKNKKRPERATDGGSAVALLAHQRPGGTHGRRKEQRRVERERAIKEAS